TSLPLHIYLPLLCVIQPPTYTTLFPYTTLFRSPTKPIKLDIDNKQVVDDLYNGLYRKRQLGYGGLFKTIKKQLQLDDVENGNLVKTSDEENDLSSGTKIVAYWNATKQNYFIKG